MVEDPQAAAWQKVADDFRRLQRAQRVPEHLRMREPFDGTEFDPQEYLEILDHLEMEDGFVLDFVYFATAYEGYPILYARPESEPRVLTIDGWSESAFFGQEYLDRIHVVDSTPDGFFQYAMLNLVGRQFYLFWHAQSRDVSIVATQGRLSALIDLYSDEMDAAEVVKARAIDPTPQVTVGSDRVTVDIVTFTAWGGFSLTSSFIERYPPHRILTTTTMLARCDCGLTF